MENNFLELLGINIKKYRLMNCYTQQQLADILYVTKQSISKWEIGKSLPTTENIMYMCPILRCSPNNLLLDSVVLLGYDETKNINYPQKPDYNLLNNSNMISSNYQNVSFSINEETNNTTTTTNINQSLNNNITYASNNTSSSTIQKNFSLNPNPFITSSSEHIDTSTYQSNRQNKGFFGFLKNKKTKDYSQNDYKIDNEKEFNIPCVLNKSIIQRYFLEKTNNKKYTNEELINKFVNSSFFKTNYDFSGLVIYNKDDDITYIFNQSTHKFDKTKKYKKVELNTTNVLFKQNNIKIIQDDDLYIIEIDKKYYILLM